MRHLKMKTIDHLTIMALILVATLVILNTCAMDAKAQTWKTANQATVGWDAVTVPSGTVSYKVYVKPETGGTETLATTVTATQATVTFSQEGRYYLGVASVRTVNAVPVESSTISWSNVAAVCQGGVTFGIQYITPPAAPVNFRTVP